MEEEAWEKEEEGGEEEGEQEREGVVCVEEIRLAQVFLCVTCCIRRSFSFSVFLCFALFFALSFSLLHTHTHAHTHRKKC